MFVIDDFKDDIDFLDDHIRSVLRGEICDGSPLDRARLKLGAKRFAEVFLEEVERSLNIRFRGLLYLSEEKGHATNDEIDQFRIGVFTDAMEKTIGRAGI